MSSTSMLSSSSSIHHHHHHHKHGVSVFPTNSAMVSSRLRFSSPKRKPFSIKSSSSSLFNNDFHGRRFLSQGIDGINTRSSSSLNAMVCFPFPFNLCVSDFCFSFFLRRNLGEIHYESNWVFVNLLVYLILAWFVVLI